MREKEYNHKITKELEKLTKYIKINNNFITLKLSSLAV